MTEHRFTDTATIAGTRITDDGYMVATVRCARTGCQTYLGTEMGLMDGTVTVYRPEDAVFSKDSLATFAHKPVTVGHPPESVTADNWRDYAVGDVGDEIARDGDFVKVPLTLMDAAAIKAVQDGTREISMGYTTPIEMRDGVAPDGTPYQAVQIGPIRINHLAIVSKARGGADLRFGDGAGDGGKDRTSWGLSPITMSDQKEGHMPDALKTVVLGDKAVQVTADTAADVEAFKAAQAKALNDAETEHAKAIAAKDAELAKANAAKDAAEAKVLSDADIDKRVAARADLIAKAKTIVSDLKTDGLSDADIRKAVVLAKLGDAAADKSEAYIDARFDILAEDAEQTDAVRDAVKGAKPIKVGDMQSVYAERNASLEDAWKAKEA